MNSQALNDTTAIRDNDRLRKAAEMRYPLYYQFLKDWETIGYKTITCHDIAAELGLKASQVLDDLESIGIIHSPRIGSILCNVVYELEVFFGWNKLNDGIRAIWNFSPVHLEVPEHILVQNQDLYSSLAALSKKLNAAVPE